MKTINTDEFWDALALDILNHENPVLAKKAANSLLSLWTELSGLYCGRGTGLSDRAFSPNRIKNLAMADNFFVEMNDLIQSVNVTQNFIDKQNPTKKSKP